MNCLGVVGFIISYFGCYIEPFPRPKPVISRPILDYHVHPVETPAPSPSVSSGSEFVETRYIPELIPPWIPQVKGNPNERTREEWKTIPLYA